MPNRAQFWSLQTNGGDGPSLYILDEIARYDSWFFDSVTPKRFQADLDRCRGDLNVWIDSPGGDAFAGSAIYSMLRAYSASGRGRVIANIAGMAASAAGLIAMAADEVRISVVGAFMLHDPLCSMEGNSEELRYNADVLDEIREGQINAYMRKSGKSHDEVLALMRGNGTWMNAGTAIENGFADKLLNDDSQWATALADARVSSCAAREAERIRSIAHSKALAPTLTSTQEIAACEFRDHAIDEEVLAKLVDGIVAGLNADSIVTGLCTTATDSEEPAPEILQEITPDDAEAQERDAQMRALLRACLS